MKHVKGLDTLRALAISFVIMEHFGVWFEDRTGFGAFVKQVMIPDGRFGVHLFFVLSGFLITTILLNERTNAATNNRFLVVKNFFARRTLRIFPIYYLLILFLAYLDYPELRAHLGYYLSYTGNILVYRTGVWSNFTHTWTLSVEEQFYLLWPWFILFVNEKYLKYVFVGAIVLGIICDYYIIDVIGRLPLLVWNKFDAFGIGGLYAYATVNKEQLRRFEQWINRVVPAAACLYLYWKITFYLHTPKIYCMSLIDTVSSVLAVWLIMRVINAKEGILKKYFLENRFLNFTGKISYGIYLYHSVYIYWYLNYINTYLDVYTRRSPAIWAFVNTHSVNYWIHVSCIVLIATISYFLIERPILGLKRFFRVNRIST